MLVNWVKSYLKGAGQGCITPLLLLCKIVQGSNIQVFNGGNFMVLGAITMKFGTMKHKKMFSRIREKIFVIFFKFCFYFCQT